MQQRRAGTDHRGVICFCGQDWWYHNRAHSDFQLMIRIASDRRVLLINSIGMRMPLPGRSARFLGKILRKLRSTSKFLRRPLPDRPDLFVMTPIAVPVFGVPVLGRLATWAIRAQVALVARCLGIRRPMICITPPTAWGVARPMARHALLYNRSDKHSAFAEANSAVIRPMELALLRQADHVLYVNRQLMAEEAELCGERAFYLDHGIDESWVDAAAHRQAADEPAELRAIPHPRIGFFGGLRPHLVDFPLLARIADELPDCQLVLIGDAPAGLDELAARPNVHWLGFRDHQDIPTLAAGFDVALMPYLVNDWIRHCNPIKLKEYLALGLPVVSSDFPAAHAYAPHVEIAPDPAAFVELVRRLCGATDSPEQRRARQAAVQDITWSRQAERLLARIDPAATRTDQATSGAPVADRATGADTVGSSK